MAVTGGADSYSGLVCGGSRCQGSKADGPGSRGARTGSLTSIRLARIELRCLEKVEEDAAGEPGSRLGVLFTAS